MQGVLGRRCHEVVLPVDVVPHPLDAEDLDRDRGSLDDLQSRSTCLLHRAEDKGDAPDVQESIARDRADDLSPQRMTPERIAESPAQGTREVAPQHHLVPGIITESRCSECRGE